MLFFFENLRCQNFSAYTVYKLFCKGVVQKRSPNSFLYWCVLVSSDLELKIIINHLKSFVNILTKMPFVFYDNKNPNSVVAKYTMGLPFRPIRVKIFVKWRMVHWDCDKS